MDRVLLSWPRPDPANPYLLRLGEALARRGMAVRSETWLAALCARPGGAPWLHVHWPEWMLHDPSRGRYRARALWLLGLLDLARAQGVALAWTAHNLVGHDDPHPDLGAAARRALLRRCRVVFGHFASAEEDVRALGFRGRFALAPHPHYADDYAAPADRAAARRALGVGDHELLLASVGAVEPYKNLTAFARAFRAVAPADFRWVVAGRGSHPAATKALVDAVAADPRITLRLGFASRETVAAIVAAADAVVLPYRAFYTSGVAMLALSLGTPVVGPPRHHLATFAGHDFFVPLADTDPTALPAALAAALATVRAISPGARGRARCHALGFGWDRAAEVVDHALFGAEP